MKRCMHILASYVTVFCFLVYSIAVPTLAYAQDKPSPVPALDVDICTNLTLVPELDISIPNLTGCQDCFAHIVSPTGSYRIYNDKGELLSISGLFLNDTASANLTAELTTLKQDWTARHQRVLGWNTACMQRQYSILESRLNALQAIYDAKEIETQRILVSKNEQIDRLSNTPWYKTTEFGVVIGVVLGIGITIGTGYALGQIQSN